VAPISGLRRRTGRADPRNLACECRYVGFHRVTVSDGCEEAAAAPRRSAARPLAAPPQPLPEPSNDNLTSARTVGTGRSRVPETPRSEASRRPPLNRPSRRSPHRSLRIAGIATASPITVTNRRRQRNRRPGRETHDRSFASRRPPPAVTLAPAASVPSAPARRPLLLGPRRGRPSARDRHAPSARPRAARRATAASTNARCSQYGKEPRRGAALQLRPRGETQLVELHDVISIASRPIAPCGCVPCLLVAWVRSRRISAAAPRSTPSTAFC